MEENEIKLKLTIPLTCYYEFHPLSLSLRWVTILFHSRRPAETNTSECTLKAPCTALVSVSSIRWTSWQIITSGRLSIRTSRAKNSTLCDPYHAAVHNLIVIYIMRFIIISDWTSCVSLYQWTAPIISITDYIFSIVFWHKQTQGPSIPRSIISIMGFITYSFAHEISSFYSKLRLLLCRRKISHSNNLYIATCQFHALKFVVQVI